MTSSHGELTNEVERPRPATAPISGRHARLDVQPCGHQDVLIRSGQLRRSYERIDRIVLTHSQPDLTRLAKLQLAPSMGMMRHNERAGSIESGSSLSFDELTAIGDSLVRRRPTELDHAAIATRATQMVERLSGENRALRSELDGYYKKVCKLQKFEMEIEKVRSGYEALVKQSQRREHLEKLMRYKLEAEIKKLRGMNTELQEDLNQALSQLLHSERNNLTETEVTKELRRKDSLMSKLITQNRDILAAKERLQLEVARQRSTVQELRAHIDVLSEALTSARSSTIKYEEEIRRRHIQEQKVDDLQKTLLQLKLLSEKRELVQQQIQQKLEQEVQQLKEHKANRNRVAMETDEGIASDSESPTSVQSLIRQMHDKEQRVLNLQAEVVKWEQKFLEESISKQLVTETAAVANREAHLSAAASVAVECGRISCENTHDAPVRYLQEFYAADNKCAIYEAKLKSLQRQMAEKDAVMRMMGGHASLDEAAGHFYASPHHSKHPSICSLSSLTATPPSSCSSRQSSQVDVSRRYSLLRPDPRPPAHSKSNSLGSSLTSDGEGDISHCPSEDPQLCFLQRNFPTQVALRGGLQSGCDQLKECFWQV
ncbi:hypothetical protein NP493_9g09000 [Ridgeia piscesae]|uniref:Angiomotin C-terminal domain-containing protein n=1 Tax=Ridgeia piscesae TaxID=27915 RepID=A0AAD9PF55_RIDPI|nr:hypothetical protein NP493_9g09000 [Ridgeia piscesae]